MKLLVENRFDRLKNRSKSPVKRYNTVIGKIFDKIPNFGKMFPDRRRLSLRCGGGGNLLMDLGKYRKSQKIVS
jgi:hypothetical protein